MTKQSYKFWQTAYYDCIWQIDFCIAFGIDVLRYYRLLNYIENRMRNYTPSTNEFKGV